MVVKWWFNGWLNDGSMVVVVKDWQWCMLLGMASRMYHVLHHHHYIGACYIGMMGVANG